MMIVDTLIQQLKQIYMSKDTDWDVVHDILEEKFFPVNYTLSTAVNINNSGVLNEEMLEKAKRAFVMETVGVWKDELVSAKQGYPVNDISDVTFDIDVVVLKRKDFDTLKGYYEQLFEEGSENLADQA